MRKDIILAITCGCLAFTILLITMYIITREPNNSLVIKLEVDDIKQVLNHTSTDYKMSSNDFELFNLSTMVSTFDTYTQYKAGSSASFTTSKVTASGANKKLYEIADEYFMCYYGSSRVSPILPMAISNVETPGRADPNLTWCALIPSRYVSVDDALTFDVTSVLKDENVFKALSSEYSTRDRGCLQMSPTYGTGNSYFNSMMSGTEVDKLKNVSSTHESWISGASNSPGDRFYLPDVLLRQSAAMQCQVDYIVKNNYTPNSDAMLIAMLACGHHNSGIWSFNSREQKVGVWNSSGKAYEWCTLLSDPEFVQILTSYAKSHPATYIDSKTAQQLWNNYSDADASSYTTNTIVCWYPIKVLYAYIKLTMLYTN